MRLGLCLSSNSRGGFGSVRAAANPGDYPPARHSALSAAATKATIPPETGVHLENAGLVIKIQMASGSKIQWQVKFREQTMSMRRILAIIMLASFWSAAFSSPVSADGSFTNNINGVWQGTYCGNSSTSWVFVLSPSRSFAREKWCNGWACGDLDYRITQVSNDQQMIEATSFHARGYSSTGHRIIFKLSGGGNQLDGTYYGHPRCDRIQMRKQTSDNINFKPLSETTPTQLPRSAMMIIPNLQNGPNARPRSADDKEQGRIHCGRVYSACESTCRTRSPYGNRVFTDYSCLDRCSQRNSDCLKRN